MKHKRIILPLCLLTIALLLSSCNINVSGDPIFYDDDLKGTSWSGDKSIISFISDSRGVLFDYYNSNNVVQFSFTYTFDSFDNTGAIEYDDIYNNYNDDKEFFEIKSLFGDDTLIVKAGNLYTENTNFTKVEQRSIY